MGRYGPGVLPSGDSPLAGFLGGLGGGFQGGLDVYAGLQRNKREADKHRIMLEELELERGRQGITRGTQTGRQQQVGSAVAEALAPTLPAAVATSFGPEGAGFGVLDATRNAVTRGWQNVQQQQGQDMVYRTPMPTTPAQQAQQRGPEMNFVLGRDDVGVGSGALGAMPQDNRIFTGQGPGEPTRPNILAGELGGQQPVQQPRVDPGANQGLGDIFNQPARPAAAARAPQNLSQYLGYTDRDRAMRPYQAGGFTVDPMQAYDRTRGPALYEAQQERDRQRAELEGVTVGDPVADRLFQAGRAGDAIDYLRIKQLKEQEAGRASRGSDRLIIAREQIASRNSINAALESGRADDRQIRLLDMYIDEVLDLKKKIQDLPARQRAGTAEDPNLGNMEQVYRSDLQDAEARLRRLLQRTGITGSAGN